MGPRTWITWRLGSSWPPVITASPGWIGAKGRLSSARPGPAAWWIAPATPPPLVSSALAAFTTASISSWDDISPSTISTVTPPFTSRSILHRLSSRQRLAAYPKLAGFEQRAFHIISSVPSPELQFRVFHQVFHPNQTDKLS